MDQQLHIQYPELFKLIKENYYEIDWYSFARSTQTCLLTTRQRERIAECHAERPALLDRLMDMDPATVEEQIMNSWSAIYKSPNIIIRDDGMLGKRNPVVESTDCLRGRKGYTIGLHVWTITWPVNYRGTHAVVGMATDKCPLQAPGYCSLVGSNQESWGWDLIRNKCYHNNQKQIYPSWFDDSVIIDVPETFQIVLDMDAGTLGFIVDRTYFGIAFVGLKGKTLYPIVSTVTGNAKIGIKYESGLKPEPLLLKQCCRKVIRHTIGKKRVSRVMNELELPAKLKRYIQNF